MPKLSPQQYQASPVEQARSQRLLLQLREQILQQGPLPFADYMEACLYTPELGYYTSGGQIFGPGGDFTTAPEMGTLFAHGLARHLAALVPQLQVQGAGTNWALMEVGAGSGQLAYDLLHALQQHGCAPAVYYIVERSPSLRQRQLEKLTPFRAHGLRVEHLDAPPSNFAGFIIANEVLDALPVTRIRLSESGWHSLAVDWHRQEERLVWCELPLSAEQSQALALLASDPGLASHWPSLCPPYTNELPLATAEWLTPYAEALEHGVILLVDYGYARAEYYHPQRSEGSLLCYYQHQAHDDPLSAPGLQDLTAFVEFTSVAETGDALGLEMMGYTNQAHFLLSSGVLEELEGIDDPLQQALLAEQARRLLLPGEMGERFQVMQFGKAMHFPGPGFAVDLSYRL